MKTIDMNFYLGIVLVFQVFMATFISMVFENFPIFLVCFSMLLVLALIFIKSIITSNSEE